MRSGSIARTSGVLTLTLTLFGWASVPLFIKHFTGTIDVWSSNGWRYGFAALLWAPVLWIARQRGRLPPGLARAAIVPSIFNAAGQVCFGAAHYLIDPGLLTFGLRTQIAFVVLGAAIAFPAERRVLRRPRVFLGIALIFAGTLATIVQDAHFGQRAGLFGVALAIGSGALFAGYGLSVRRWLADANPLLAFAMVSQYTALGLVGLMLALGAGHGTGPVALPGGELALLLGSAVIGIALGHVLYFLSIQRLGVTVTSGVLQLQPVLVSIASAAIFADAALQPLQWLSGCVGIVGAAIVLTSPQP